MAHLDCPFDAPIFAGALVLKNHLRRHSRLNLTRLIESSGEIEADALQSTHGYACSAALIIRSNQYFALERSCWWIGSARKSRGGRRKNETEQEWCVFLSDGLVCRILQSNQLQQRLQVRTEELPQVHGHTGRNQKL